MTAGRSEPLDGMLPLRGRWLRYLGFGAGVLAGAAVLPWPAPVLVPLALLLTLGAAHVRRRVLGSRVRIRSVDVGAGILLIPETGGPVWESLRCELERWQRSSSLLAPPGEGDADWWTRETSAP